MEIDLSIDCTAEIVWNTAEPKTQLVSKVESSNTMGKDKNQDALSMEQGARKRQRTSWGAPESNLLSSMFYPCTISAEEEDAYFDEPYYVANKDFEEDPWEKDFWRHSPAPAVTFSAYKPLGIVTGEDEVARWVAEKGRKILQQKPPRVNRRWTDMEEKRFEEALKLYGRDWQLCANYIGTKEAAHVRSHAQKHFIRLYMEGKPVPGKCKETGTGHTLSGKPLDPNSGAARGYLERHRNRKRAKALAALQEKEELQRLQAGGSRKIVIKGWKDEIGTDKKKVSIVKSRTTSPAAKRKWIKALKGAGRERMLKKYGDNTVLEDAFDLPQDDKGDHHDDQSSNSDAKTEEKQKDRGARERDEKNEEEQDAETKGNIETSEKKAIKRVKFKLS